MESQDLEVYVAGAHVGPHPLLTRENHDQESQAALIACDKKLIMDLSKANRSCSSK